MRFKFAWNEFADQPHNVAPRSERTRHHIRHWRTYFSMIWADILYGVPALFRYRRLRREMFRRPVAIERRMFAAAVSPRPGRNEEVLALLEETGVRETLLRIPSWEMDKLDEYEKFARLIRGRGMGLTIALLQRREDVFETAAWARFVEDVFARFSPVCRHFEIGHAWNRTKWGVWDYTEYLSLARPAFALREKYGIRLVGPAVIDFEFHLYPPTLRALPFDVVSSLLYVDRVGAPENAQFGWTAAKKIALFKAVTESSARRPCGCWITEVNWPLAGTGPYSPASGKPNVTEEEQADYLVRYFIIALASGLIERVYWWQLVAPGYGLVDGGRDVCDVCDDQVVLNDRVVCDDQAAIGGRVDQVVLDERAVRDNRVDRGAGLRPGVHWRPGPRACPGVLFRRTRPWLKATGEWRAEGSSLDWRREGLSLAGREEPWRKRPAWFALRQLIETLAESEFTGKDAGRPARGAEIYRFRKAGKDFAVCWTNDGCREFEFDRPVDGVADRDGRALAPARAPERSAGRCSQAAPDCGRIEIGRSPKYVAFK